MAADLSLGFTGLALARAAFGKEAEIHVYGMNWKGDVHAPYIHWNDEELCAKKVFRVHIHPTLTEEYNPLTSAHYPLSNNT